MAGRRPVVWSNAAAYVCAVLVLGGVVGCSSDGRVGSSGMITYDGQPLADGAISFHPIDTSLAPEGGLIINGAFQIRSRPGRHRVEIYASRPKVGVVELTPGMTPTEQFIPARYNADSSLEVDVIERGPNRFSFELVSESDTTSGSTRGK